MATQGAITTFTTHQPWTIPGSRRVNQSAADFGAEHVTDVLGFDASGTAPSGSGRPKTSLILWTKSGVSYTTEVITYQESGESEGDWTTRHNEGAAAVATAITNAGGTITSGP